MRQAENNRGCRTLNFFSGYDVAAEKTKLTKSAHRLCSSVPCRSSGLATDSTRHAQLLQPVILVLRVIIECEDMLY